MTQKANDPEVCKVHFNAVYDSTYDRIKRFAAIRCADPQALADILQDTYLAYFRLIRKYGVDYAKDPESVLCQIAKRKIFRYYSLRQKLASILPLFRENDKGETYCIADEEGCFAFEHTEETILSDLESKRIWDRIGLYPPETRKVLYLYFALDMPLAEIAEKTGLSLPNVKNKLYRTLAEIQKSEKGEKR